MVRFVPIADITCRPAAAVWSPPVAQRSRASVGLRVVGEVPVEFCKHRNATLQNTLRHSLLFRRFRRQLASHYARQAFGRAVAELRYLLPPIRRGNSQDAAEDRPSVSNAKNRNFVLHDQLSGCH